MKTGIINWVNDINSNITPIIINNLIFTVSNEGYLFVVEKKYITPINAPSSEIMKLIVSGGVAEFNNSSEKQEQ